MSEGVQMLGGKRFQCGLSIFYPGIKKTKTAYTAEKPHLGRSSGSELHTFIEKI
jgi:hypothetical protein